MGLRWYTVVVDCLDVAAQSKWWAEALGWKPVYESPDEVVLVPGYATPELVESMPWDRVPPGLVFVPVADGSRVKNRLHIDLAPHTSDDRDAEIARLLAMGATTSRRRPGTPTRPGTCSPTPRATSSACCPHATP